MRAAAAAAPPTAAQPPDVWPLLPSADPQYVKNADFLEHIEMFIPSSCDDTTVLSRDEQARCRMCQRRTAKAACLATLSGTWHGGSDRQSCTWVDRDALGRTVREHNCTLGVNMPFQVRMLPCRTSLEPGTRWRDSTAHGKKEAMCCARTCSGLAP